MEFDWYSGSDESGLVPAKLQSFVKDSDDWELASKIEFLDRLLDVEREPNWVGHINHLAGAEFYLARRYEDAVGRFLVAESSFSQVLASIKNVTASFCRNRLGLIREKLIDDEDSETIIEYGLSILAWQEDDTFSDYEKRVLFSNLGFAFANMAEGSGVRLFDRLALQVRLRSRNLEPGEPNQIEDLFLSYLAIGNFDGCARAIKEVSELENEQHRAEEMKSLLKQVQGQTD